jgi:hypothetical protein
LNAPVVGKTGEMLPLAQMHRWILHFLEPAPTSPFNPFHGRRDNRSVHQQVVSGLRLGGGLVAGLLILGLAYWSISALLANAHSSAWPGHFCLWFILCFASVMMFVTVNRWVPFVPAFYLLTLMRSLGVLTFGLVSSASTAADWASRKDLLGPLVFCVVVVALTWRFIGNIPAPTTFLDRVALTFFVLAQLNQMAISYHRPPLPLILGFSALLITWCVYRWNRAGMTRKYLNDKSITSETLPEPKITPD